ncbi:MAG: glycosyltransferase family 2 protein, partial [Actinomycetota bacterium]
MKVGIVVVAYNAERTLAATLDRIDPDFATTVCEILVLDDYSADRTAMVAAQYRDDHPDLPVTVIRQQRNLGYGGNQKSGYRYALDHGWDVAVMLHGDGQYAPELLESMVEPILAGRA